MLPAMPAAARRHVERLKRGLPYEEFEELLRDTDTLMRSLPPTAQVAAQEGKYLAKLLSRYVRVCAWACGFGGAGLG